MCTWVPGLVMVYDLCGGLGDFGFWMLVYFDGLVCYGCGWCVLVCLGLLC